VIDFEKIIGFDWDDGNSQKNWEKHRVSTGECEEVFFNLPLLLREDPGHSQREPRFYILGHSKAGRLLFIAFTIRRDKIRIISTRDMSRKERAFYEQENS
jgi:uncharacterized DUF497 family protein